MYSMCRIMCFYMMVKPWHSKCSFKLFKTICAHLELGTCFEIGFSKDLSFSLRDTFYLALTLTPERFKDSINSKFKTFSPQSVFIFSMRFPYSNKSFFFLCFFEDWHPSVFQSWLIWLVSSTTLPIKMVVNHWDTTRFWI